MVLLDQPTPARSGDAVSFTALLPPPARTDAAAIEAAARSWVRGKKTEMMRDFTALDTYGHDAAYSARVIVQGPPSFDAHKALGALGFRLESGKGQTAYKLPLISHWHGTHPGARFEQAIRAVVPQPVPLARCRDAAMEFAKLFALSFNAALDFSSGSLGTLSRFFIQQERSALSPVLFLPSTVMAAGCYLGEALIHEAFATHWLEHEDENHCNLVCGLTRLNPWSRVLDLCVRGSEATLSGYLDETQRLRQHDTPSDAWYG